jgi:hypothetical protein
VEKTGRKRPWKSLRDFHFSHSFNNNKLDDRDHFLQNAKTSVASLRRLITPSRNADHDQPGILITFIGIRNFQRVRHRVSGIVGALVDYDLPNRRLTHLQNFP